MASEPPKVFISYSHRDKQWLDDLETNLKPYLRDSPLTSWSDIRIQAGSEWFAEMQSALTSCDIAVLLVSPDFLHSDFIHEQELGPVLKEATRRGLKILWVPIRDSAYKKTPLKDYQAVLDPSKPLARMTKARRDKAWIKICEEIEKAANRLEEPLLEAASNATGRELALSNLPDRNLFFTGRERVLAELQEALTTRGRVALSGLGGVGKTQTAIEYVHRHLSEYNYAFWVTAASREALVSGYMRIAGLLKLSEADTEDQMHGVEAVKHWLGLSHRWLLILDNADDILMARAFLPKGNNGHVILTTRAQAAGVTARRVEIQEMKTEEGALFLLRRAKYIAEGAVFEAADETDRARAQEIVALVDGLPLALDQCAAYVEETACGFLGYLTLYQSHALELLRLRGTLTSDHPDPVAKTWALSFDKIEKANPAAADLLRCCAFLHPDGIPEEVFSKGVPELGPALGSVGSDALAWNDALSEILKYSLLRRDPDASTLEIHRLVQTVLKRGMDESNQRLWSERVVRALIRAFPFVEFSTWSVCDRLLPQAQACAELINQWGFGFADAALLLNQAGFYLFKRGRYVEAEPLFNRAFVIYERAQGPEHPNVANSLNNLVRLYRAQERYVEAEPLCERALAIREKALGPKDPLVAESLNNLAALYRAQGQYVKAEPLYGRALRIVENLMSPEDPLVASSLNNLALFYQTLGQYAKAEPLYQRALAIRERALPPEHPNVATSLNNLAVLYSNQGQYAKALPLYERALAIRENALGAEHPDVATCLENYAILLRKMNRPEGADRLESRAKAIRANSLHWKSR